MKKVLLLIIFIYLTFFIYADDLANYSKEINDILNNIERLVNKQNVKELIERTEFFKEKINNQEVFLKIDKDIEKNIFTGIGVAVPKGKNEKPYVYFYKEIIDLYKKQPSIVMSAFIHEMQHVYDYYYNRDLFMVSYDNVLEKYFFEMDAYHIEGLFINEVLKKEKISLSKFETLLSDSLKENNLDYFSIVFKGINMRQIYSYTGFVNKNNLKKTIKLYINDGKKIIENYKIEEKDDAWIKYQKIVPVFTYFYFIPQLTYDVVINKTDKKIKPTNFNLKKQYPELNEIWEKMRDIYNEEQDFFNNFGKEVNNNYNM